MQLFSALTTAFTRRLLHAASEETLDEELV